VWYATCCVIIHFSSYGYENNLWCVLLCGEPCYCFNLRLDAC
jgi:hypothetical protein